MQGFCHTDVRVVEGPGEPELRVEIRAHAQRRRLCSIGEPPAPTYDRLERRERRHVGLWRIVACFMHRGGRTAPCTGLHVEAMPWNEGKRPWTRAMMVFLARGARRLSRKEAAEAFDGSREAVCRSAQRIVEGGLAHRVLTGIRAIGPDELRRRKGKKSANFLTLICPADEDCRRLLWVGLRRTERSLRQGLTTLGAEVVAGIRVVVGDMWRPYPAVVRKHMSPAVQILERFRLTALLNKAVDQVRRGECAALRGGPRGKRRKKTRWLPLRPRTRVRGKARVRPDAVMHSKLRTARAWTMKEAFAHFRTCHHPRRAKAFLDAWISRTLRSQLAPVRKVARTLRDHEPLILN